MALAAVSLTVLSAIHLNLISSRDLIYFTFFATVAGYNFAKYFESGAYKNRRLIRLGVLISIMSLFSLSAAAYFMFKLSDVSKMVIGLSTLFTFLYVVPKNTKSEDVLWKQSLRNIRGVKVFIIALVWTLTTVILPFVESHRYFQFDVLLLVIQRFVFILVLMIPFEIRDLKYDHIRLATIPQRLGILRAKKIGYILLIVAVGIELMLDSRFIIKALSCILFAVVGMLVREATENQSEYYSSFWVESIPLFWLGAILLFD